MFVPTKILRYSPLSEHSSQLQGESIIKIRKVDLSMFCLCVCRLEARDR